MAERSARRLLLLRGAIIGSAALLAVTAWLAYRRYHVPAAQQELLWYFQEPFKSYHERTRSLQAALVGLVEEPLPSPETAVGILDDNVLPSTDELLEEMRALRLREIDTRMLHAGYLQAVEQMRGDAVTVKQIFADGGKDVGERRRLAAERIVQVGSRFDAFYVRAVEIWKENGIVVAPPKGAGAR